MNPTSTTQYVTRGGIGVRQRATSVLAVDAIEGLIDRLDRSRGVLLSSSYEYPGRYTRWDLGFADPMLVVTAKGRRVSIHAPGRRGAVLLDPILSAVREDPAVASITRSADTVEIEVHEPSEWVPEEQRSRQPSVFSTKIHTLACMAHSDTTSHTNLNPFRFGPRGQMSSVIWCCTCPTN
jgi:anthranilate synthase